MTAPGPLRVAGIALAVLVAMAALAPGQLADPFFRADDMPVLLQDPAGYFPKLPAEGRWINWLWLHRPWPSDPVAVVALYWALSALGAALIGCGLFRHDPRPWRAALAALAIGFAPEQTAIALWPATTVPAQAVLTLFAAAALWLRPMAVLALLPLAVATVLMCHGSYPAHLFVVAAAVVRWPPSGARATGLALVWAAGMVLGILAIFTVNWVELGHFGLQIAEWRAPRVPQGPEDLLANLALVTPWMQQTLAGLGAGQGPVAVAVVGLVLAGAVLLVRHAPAAAPVVLAGPVLGLMFGAALLVVLGTGLPFRSAGFVWIGCACILARAAEASSGRTALAMLGGLVLKAAMGALLWAVLHGSVARFQSGSALLAAAVEHLSRPGDRLVILGDPWAAPGGGALSRFEGLQLRLARLTGMRVLHCRAEPPATCPDLAPAFEGMPAWPDPGALRRDAGRGLILLRLPDPPPGAPVPPGLPEQAPWSDELRWSALPRGRA